jgi:hypothetical protein
MKLRVGGRALNIAEFGRAEFKAERWRYIAGEHNTFIAPTQQGKTTWAYELIEVTAHPRLPALSLIMKPRDKVPAQWLKKLGHPRLQTFPPPFWRKMSRASGWGLWPKRTGNVRRDNVMLSDRFAGALNHAYEHGNMIVFCDEAVGLSRILKLDPELIALWMQGGGMGGGLWAASQKPSHMPTWAYNQAEHLFLGPEPDARNRKRFGEIGGVDPRVVEAAVMELDKYHWVYLRRTGSVMCIVR